MAVIDASALVKAFVEETGSDKAKRLLDTGAHLAMPAHGPAEVVEVLVRKRDSDQISEFQLERAIVSLNALVTIVPLQGLLTDAARISVREKISVYDSLYVAAAAAADTTLISSDEKLLRRLMTTAHAKRIVRLETY